MLIGWGRDVDWIGGGVWFDGGGIWLNGRYVPCLDRHVVGWGGIWF